MSSHVILLLPVFETGLTLYAIPIVLVAFIIFKKTKKQRDYYQQNGDHHIIVYFKNDPGEELLAQSNLKEFASWRKIKNKYYRFYSKICADELREKIAENLKMDLDQFKVVSVMGNYIPS